MPDYDIDQDAQETAWAASLGFDSASDYHAAAEELFIEETAAEVYASVKVEFDPPVPVNRDVHIQLTYDEAQELYNWLNIKAKMESTTTAPHLLLSGLYDLRFRTVG